jgi:hypothetical protein
MKQRHGSIGRKLLALVAVVGVAVVGILATGTTVEARHRVPRARIDLDFTAFSDPPVVVVGEEIVEIVSYVGTIDFGRRGKYGIAFFSTGPPTPLCDGSWCGDWAQFSDRYEIYRETDFYEVEDERREGELFTNLTSFDRPTPIIEATEWGFGSNERNVFYGFGRVEGDPDVDKGVFRHVDDGDRLFYRGKFIKKGTQFVGTFKVFSH